MNHRGKKPKKLLILRGLPGAGKTTEALAWMCEHPGQRARVCRAELRASMFPHVRAPEGAVIAAQVAVVRQLLRNQYDVVVDDPNLDEASVSRWVHIAGQVGGTIHEVINLLHVPVEVCIERAARTEQDADTIRHLHRQHVLGDLRKRRDTP